MSTALNPQWIASRVARIAATTEAKPLTAQAQGTSTGVRAATLARPRGKGIPIAKARGAISSTAIPILTTSSRPIR